MFIMVMNDEDKEKLILLGHKYISGISMGDKFAHLFEWKKEFNFDKHKINYIVTDRLTF